MLVSVEKPIGRFFQQPWEIKRYRVDFTLNLGDNEIVSLLSFLVDNTTSPPLDVTNAAIAPEGKEITFFVGGGLSGNSYKVTIRTTTTVGQRFEDEIEFVIQER